MIHVSPKDIFVLIRRSGGEISGKAIHRVTKDRVELEAYEGTESELRRELIEMLGIADELRAVSEKDCCDG